MRYICCNWVYNLEYVGITALKSILIVLIIISAQFMQESKVNDCKRSYLT